MNTLWNWLKRGIEVAAWGALSFCAGTQAMLILQKCAGDCTGEVIATTVSLYMTLWGMVFALSVHMDMWRNMWMFLTNKTHIREENWVKEGILRLLKKTALLAFWGISFFEAGVNVQHLTKTMYTITPDILLSFASSWLTIMVMEMCLIGLGNLFTESTAWLSGVLSGEKRKRKALEQKPHLVIPAAAGLDSELFESYSELLIHLNESKK